MISLIIINILNTYSIIECFTLAKNKGFQELLITYDIKSILKIHNSEKGYLRI